MFVVVEFLLTNTTIGGRPYVLVGVAVPALLVDESINKGYLGTYPCSIVP